MSIWQGGVKVITKDEMEDDCRGCDPESGLALTIGATCHPGAGLEVQFVGGEGRPPIMHVGCALCHGEVVHLLLGSEADARAWIRRQREAGN